MNVTLPRSTCVIISSMKRAHQLVNHPRLSTYSHNVNRTRLILIPSLTPQERGTVSKEHTLLLGFPKRTAQQNAKTEKNKHSQRRWKKTKVLAWAIWSELWSTRTYLVSDINSKNLSIVFETVSSWYITFAKINEHVAFLRTGSGWEKTSIWL